MSSASLDETGRSQSSLHCRPRPLTREARSHHCAAVTDLYVLLVLLFHALAYLLLSLVAFLILL